MTFSIDSVLHYVKQTYSLQAPNRKLIFLILGTYKMYPNGYLEKDIFFTYIGSYSIITPPENANPYIPQPYNLIEGNVCNKFGTKSDIKMIPVLMLFDNAKKSNWANYQLICEILYSTSNLSLRDYLIVMIIIKIGFKCWKVSQEFNRSI